MKQIFDNDVDIDPLMTNPQKEQTPVSATKIFSDTETRMLRKVIIDQSRFLSIYHELKLYILGKVIYNEC